MSPKIRHKVNIGVGPNSRWNVCAAELIAIFFALQMIRLEHIWNTALQNPTRSNYTVLSDSRSALQAIAISKPRTAQHIIQRINTEAERSSKGCDAEIHLG